VSRDSHAGRQAGLLVPLFSIPSRESWGIGEIPDLTRLAAWMREAGFGFVQLLPVNEMAEGQSSPYSALSAMAIDPLFIAPGAVPDVSALGGDARLDEESRRLLEGARGSRSIAYGPVRTVKERIFRAAFDRFRAVEWPDGPRARDLRAFIERAAWWLHEYTLFRALHARYGRRHWREWDPPLRDRHPEALARAGRELADERLYYAYLQWIAADQWNGMRAAAGIGVFGDFPFMVSGDSADVWSRQQDFRFDASVGTPPDAFSSTGQDWGFPAYRWPEVAGAGYEWLAARARRSGELYDGYRVDHLVGFFRTYVREPDGRAAFVPADEPEQIAQGTALLRLFTSSGARVIAEDLGVIPDFVRAVLTKHHVPGYKVLRWEREWKAEGQPFRDPLRYPACAVATTGTHDTETLAEWWDAAPEEERCAVAEIAHLRDRDCDPRAPFGPRIRDAVLEVLFASTADIVLLPIQDVFGWRDRINTPALVSADNWTWRLPWPVEDLLVERDARERAGFIRELAARYGRLSSGN
jgi:4-alpha-glucanotransferase